MESAGLIGEPLRVFEHTGKRERWESSKYVQFQSDARVTNPASVLGFVYSKNLTAFNGGQFHSWSHAARSHADACTLGKPPGVLPISRLKGQGGGVVCNHHIARTQELALHSRAAGLEDGQLSSLLAPYPRNPGHAATAQQRSYRPVRGLQRASRIQSSRNAKIDQHGGRRAF